MSTIITSRCVFFQKCNVLAPLIRLVVRHLLPDWFSKDKGIKSDNCGQDCDKTVVE